MLRLNAQGWTVPVIAEIFECHEHTVRATPTMARQGWGIMGGSRTGCKTKWQEADLQTVEQWIEQDARTYNSHQLEAIRAEAGQAKPRRLRHLLQKRLWMETNSSQPPRQARP